VEEDEEKAVELLMTTSYGLCSRPAFHEVLCNNRDVIMYIASQHLYTLTFHLENENILDLVFSQENTIQILVYIPYH